MRDAVLGLRLDEQLIRDSRASAERIERALRDLHQRIHATNGFEEKRARRFKSGRCRTGARRLVGRSRPPARS